MVARNLYLAYGLVSECDEQSQFRKRNLIGTWTVNILRETGWEGVDWMHETGQGPVACCCKHGNGLSSLCA